MIDRASINNLRGLVGFENPANPSYKKVTTTNSASRSGRYFTDNPYCKIEYIMDCQDYKDISQKDFNTLLTKIQSAAIIKVCDNVFTNEDFIQRGVLYPYANNFKTAETIDSGFIGYRIRKCSGISFQIKRVFCEFANTGTFTLLLLCSNQSTALKSQLITISTTKHQEIALTDWIINNTTNYGGDYFIGFIKGSMSPYKRDYDKANIKTVYNHLLVENISVKDHAVNTIFDLDNIQVIAENNGINPDIVVYKDRTDEIEQSEILFAPAIQLAGQLEIIKLIVSSFRGNYNQRVTKEMTEKMLFEIEGNPDLRIYGLKVAFDREIKKLKESFKQDKRIMQGTLQ